MDIRTKSENNVLIIYLSGRLDVNAAKIIEVIGASIRDDRTNLLFNLQDVEFMDNNGLSILVIAYKYAVSEGAIIKLCNVPTPIKNMLQAAHLHEVFEAYREEAFAVQSFEKITKIDKLHLRRRFARLELGAQAEFKLSITSKPTYYKGKVMNLSGLGMFIYSKKTFPVGSELDITLRLVGETRPLKLNGICMWLADKELQPHVWPGMGIQFVGLSDAAQKKIIDFVDKNVDHRTGELTQWT